MICHGYLPMDAYFTPTLVGVNLVMLRMRRCFAPSKVGVKFDIAYQWTFICVGNCFRCLHKQGKRHGKGT